MTYEEGEHVATTLDVLEVCLPLGFFLTVERSGNRGTSSLSLLAEDRQTRVYTAETPEEMFTFLQGYTAQQRRGNYNGEKNAKEEDRKAGRTKAPAETGESAGPIRGSFAGPNTSPR